MKSEDLVAIGIIVGTHGVQGSCKVKVLSSHPERFQGLKQVWLDSARGVTSFSVENCVPYREGMLIKLTGLNSREDAALYKHARLCVAENEVYPLPEGEYYHFQLLGLDVWDETRGLLGRLTEVLETGANDVYVVASDRYGEILIPALLHVVLKIDLAERRMEVRLPDGLIDDEI